VSVNPWRFAAPKKPPVFDQPVMALTSSM
jgi:hypothetical protein